MYIYKITNKVNGKIYIGQTTQSTKPKRRWLSHLSNARRGVKSPLYNAMRKYGQENFEHEIIDGANSDTELNYKEIHYIHKYNCISPNGYNLKLGNQPHVYTKDKLSITMKENVDIEKMKILTELSKLKSQTKILAFNDSDRIIFESLKKAAEYINGSYKYLGEILNGKRYYKMYGGYFFEYLDKPTNKKIKHKRLTKTEQSNIRGESRIIKYGSRHCTVIRSVKCTNIITNEVKIYEKTKDVELDGFKLKTIRTYLYKTRNNPTNFKWEFYDKELVNG